jgi:hypothetical protein
VSKVRKKVGKKVGKIIINKIGVAIICTIGNIATLQPRLDIPLISHVGCDVAKFKI